MFRRYRETDETTVRIHLEGRALDVPAADSVAAALLANGVSVFRTTAVSGAGRGPYCMIGVCFDCLVEIDAQANRQACQIRVRDGMQIRRQAGAVAIAP